MVAVAVPRDRVPIPRLEEIEFIATRRSFEVLLELDRKVFGNVMAKEIIGADPPAEPDTRERLEEELARLVGRLESAPRRQLEDLLERQRASDAHVNSRPGAMALAQGKIRIYNEYSKRYASAIRSRLQGG